MRTRAEVGADKLRGGFYSPPALVHACLSRLQDLLGTRSSLHGLEPSAGDGAFVRGLARHPLARQVSQLTAVEPLAQEAAKCGEALAMAPFAGNCEVKSAIGGVRQAGDIDFAMGNPPYVRFQFLSAEDQLGIVRLGDELGLKLGGVGNLWIPVLLEALRALKIGGAFAFIIPAECFTGVSASALRHWLLDNTEELRVDLFEIGAFPSVLQEVIVLSGRRTEPASTASRLLVISPHETGQAPWQHRVDRSARTWTRYLLTPRQVSAYEQVRLVSSVVPVGAIAKFTVGTVSGANSFFCVDDETLRKYDLSAWARPLLPKLRFAPGPLFGSREHDAVRAGGHRAWLLDFSADRPDPMRFAGSRRYLALGEELGLPLRYKCRVRSPWYRVPIVRPGAVMLNKRSHLQPRMVLNEMSVLTTDTIYQAKMKPGLEQSASSLVFGFHSSISLLSVEVEGRSFAGGVLELVPSEIARLVVPFSERLGTELDRIGTSHVTAIEDQIALVEEVDRVVGKLLPEVDGELLEDLRTGRMDLQRRRLDRNEAASPVAVED
jgi:adenine-specific DNA-methyltransferase